MSQSETHPIRNGVIATVLGTLIVAALGYLWAPAGRVLGFLWAAVVAVGHALAASHLVPGWLLLLLGCGTCAFLLVRVAALVRGISLASPYSSYTADTLFGAVWHWSWRGGQISHLWASCPLCQAELVHLNERDNYLMAIPHAKFYCEHCREVRVDISGGSHQYALSAVEREIRRKLRVSQERAREVAS